jgi:hypothetical protein
MSKYQKDWAVEYDKAKDAKFLAFVAQMIEIDWEEKKSR